MTNMQPFLWKKLATSLNIDAFGVQNNLKNFNVFRSILTSTV